MAVITTLGILAALVAIPIAMRIGALLIGPLFAGAALRGAAQDIGRRAIQKQPDRVHLSERGPHVWRHPDQAGALAMPLLENGFTDVGTFAVEEMPGVFVRLMVDARNGILGIVYEHPRAAHWLELISRYPDGTSASFTTLRPTGHSPRPGHPIVFAPALDAGALLVRTLKERPPQATNAITRKSAVQQFEDGYADTIAWRKNRGVSATEVIRVATRRAA